MFLTPLLIAGLLLSAVLTTVIADELDDSAAPPPASAEEAFGRYCAPCHGVDGRGGGPQAAGLGKAVPDLTTLTVRSGGTFPRERLARLIDGRDEISAHGSREMPVWGDWFKLEGEEAYEGTAGEEARIRKRIEDLIDIVQSMQEQ
jgi:mono/diheme cytochrome c family protein